MFPGKQLQRTLRAVLLSTALSAAIAGCGGGGGGGNNVNSFLNNANTNGEVTTYGPTVPMGNGTGRAYMTVRGNVPISAGVELSAQAMTNLPLPPPGQLATEFIFPAPPEVAATTPYQQVSLFYSPGHPPPDQQDVPHIHPTWWNIAPADRAQIQPNTPGATASIAPNEIPANHITLAAFAFIPTVGQLWIDPVIPGYKETPMVTTAYEYRFFNHHMVLISLDAANTFMNNKLDYIAAVEVPQTYPKPGYYPTEYHIRWDSTRNVWDMSIDNFVLR